MLRHGYDIATSSFHDDKSPVIYCHDRKPHYALSTSHRRPRDTYTEIYDFLRTDLRRTTKVCRRCVTGLKVTIYCHVKTDLYRQTRLSHARRCIDRRQRIPIDWLSVLAPWSIVRHRSVPSSFDSRAFPWPCNGARWALFQRSWSPNFVGMCPYTCRFVSGTSKCLEVHTEMRCSFAKSKGCLAILKPVLISQVLTSNRLKLLYECDPGTDLKCPLKFSLKLQAK